MTPEEMVTRLLYRDGLMLVIDKPAGIAVHRGPKGGESLEDHFDALRFGLPRVPALAHRLDRDTSGCLVLGRHRKALAALGRMFKNGTIGKTYWAVVEGGPAEDEGRIDIPLAKRDATRGWWMKPDPEGQPAVTTWKVMGRGFFTSPWRGEVDRQKAERVGVSAENDSPHPDGFAAYPPPPGEGKQAFTWLAMEPVTGRTHQLRVHAAESGWPIVGDNIYGSASQTEDPILHLHSREIVVPISKNKPPVATIAPVPAHMQERLRACGWVEGATPQ